MADYLDWLQDHGRKVSFGKATQDDGDESKPEDDEDEGSEEEAEPEDEVDAELKQRLDWIVNFGKETERNLITIFKLIPDDKKLEALLAKQLKSVVASMKPLEKVVDQVRKSRDVYLISSLESVRALIAYTISGLMKGMKFGSPFKAAEAGPSTKDEEAEAEDTEHEVEEVEEASEVDVKTQRRKVKIQTDLHKIIKPLSLEIRRSLRQVPEGTNVETKGLLLRKQKAVKPLIMKISTSLTNSVNNLAKYLTSWKVKNANEQIIRSSYIAIGVLMKNMAEALAKPGATPDLDVSE